MLTGTQVLYYALSGTNLNQSNKIVSYTSGLPFFSSGPWESFHLSQWHFSSLLSFFMPFFSPLLPASDVPLVIVVFPFSFFCLFMLLSSQSFFCRCVLLSLVLISSLQSLLRESRLCSSMQGPREPSSLFHNMLVTYINMQLKIAPTFFFLVSQVTHYKSKIFPLVCEDAPASLASSSSIRITMFCVSFEELEWF